MTKSVTIAIPCLNQMEVGKTSLFCFDKLTSPACKFILIDNGSQQNYERFTKVCLSKKWRYVRNNENIGLLRSIQQAYELCDTDILILTHNDVWIYSSYWDKIIGNLFDDIYMLGGCGLFGGKGCGAGGHRLDTFGSLIDIEGHGRKMTMPWEPACVFDGFFMAYSREMLQKAGGFDQRYHMHHIYDLDSSLTSIDLGYKNIVANIPCHHLSGMTANNDAFATSGNDVHQANSAKFFDKWLPKLGVSVDDNFNY